MYELFVLGKLMHRPMHGYLLQSIINRAVGPFRRLGWGTLYPLLRKLEQSGSIAVHAGNSSDSRRTKRYRTTPHGRARFFQLMRARSDADADYRDLFRVKLSNFEHIGKEDQHFILREYRAFLVGIVTHSKAMSGEVLSAKGLAETERPYVLEAIDHQGHLAECEVAWVDRLAKKLGAIHGRKIEKSATRRASVARKHHSGSARRSSKSR